MKLGQEAKVARVDEPPKDYSHIYRTNYISSDTVDELLQTAVKGGLSSINAVSDITALDSSTSVTIERLIPATNNSGKVLNPLFSVTINKIAHVEYIPSINDFVDLER
jgi:hypothetical protein